MKKSVNKEYVSDFLNKVHEILDSEYFDIQLNFTLSKRDKNSDFLFNYDIDINEVPEIINSLEISNFSECITDEITGEDLFVFGKYIDNTEVYIKIRIEYYLLKKVICISFHGAEYDMIYPFKEVN